VQALNTTDTPTFNSLKLNVTGLLKAAGSSVAVAAAVAGTDYVAPSALASYALLNSPAFTGTPTAPTAAKSSADTTIATTAFAKSLFYSPSTSGTADWNHASNLTPGVGDTLLLGTATNGPGRAIYYHPLNISYSDLGTGGQITQLAISYASHGDDLWMRGRYNSSWSSWVRFLNSSNYNSYSPTLTGGGASGTWGINISGTAAYATTCANYLPLSGGSLTGTVYTNSGFNCSNTTIAAGTYGGATRGYLYNDGSGIGFLSNGGGWALRVNYGTYDVDLPNGGNLILGGANTDPASNNTAGLYIAAGGYISMTRSGSVCGRMNRSGSDGTILVFHQDGTAEGSISVSGTTVSYGAFCGTHWSQLADNSRPDILIGTVVESIDAKCEWPGEENDQLAKFKISDTPASKAVYGVFMTWDNDDLENNDAMIASLGAYIVRIAAGVTVSVGDLLESNGDGCARVQESEAITSRTIGKVTCSMPTHTYEDGSYTVPSVLYCG
jgi:hypothetical protein